MEEGTILSKETVIQSSVWFCVCFFLSALFICIVTRACSFAYRKESAGSRGEAMGGEKNQ